MSAMGEKRTLSSVTETLIDDQRTGLGNSLDTNQFLAFEA